MSNMRLVFFDPADFDLLDRNQAELVSAIANDILSENSELVDDNGEPKLVIDMERV